MHKAPVAGLMDEDITNRTSQHTSHFKLGKKNDLSMSQSEKMKIKHD